MRPGHLRRDRLLLVLGCRSPGSPSPVLSADADGVARREPNARRHRARHPLHADRARRSRPRADRRLQRNQRSRARINLRPFRRGLFDEQGRRRRVPAEHADGPPPTAHQIQPRGRRVRRVRRRRFIFRIDDLVRPGGMRVASSEGFGC